MSNNIELEFDISFRVAIKLADLVHSFDIDENEIAEAIKDGNQEELLELLDRLPNNFSGIFMEQSNFKITDFSADKDVARIKVGDDVLINNLTNQ